MIVMINYDFKEVSWKNKVIYSKIYSWNKKNKL